MTVEANLNPAVTATPEAPKSAAEPQAAPASPDPAASAAPSPEEKKPEEAPKPEDRFASKFAALSRKERSVSEREKALKDREAKLAEYETDQKLKDEDPYAWAEKHGITYAGYTERVLKGNPNPTDKKLKEIEDKLKKKEEEEAEKSKADVSRQVEGFLQQIRDFGQTNKDAYELTIANGMEDTVYHLIEQHFEKTEAAGKPRVLSLKEAYDQVEAHLEEKATELLKLAKIQKRFAPAPATDTEKKPESNATAGNKTLSNDHQSDLPASGGKKLTDEESLKLAASLIRFK